MLSATTKSGFSAAALQALADNLSFDNTDGLHQGTVAVVDGKKIGDRPLTVAFLSAGKNFASQRDDCGVLDRRF